jgi:tetratricopeptide (TPR) repeat protein
MAWRANKPVEARALLDRGQAAYEQLGDAVGAARVATQLADVDFIEGHPPQAVARLEPALAALEEAGAPPADIAIASAQLGRFLYFSGEPDRVLPYLERALSLAEELDLPETLAEALNSKSGLLFSHGHRPREAAILLEGALALALENDLHSAALRAYNNLIASLWVGGQWRACIANHERGLELARRVGDRQWESTFTAGPTGMLMMLGLWDEALSMAAEAEALGITDFLRGLLLHVAPIYLHRGDIDGARRLLSESESTAHSENASWAAMYALTKAEADAAEGRHDAALAGLERALELRENVTGYQALLRFAALEVVRDFADEAMVHRLLDVVDELNPGEQGAFLRAQKARFRARLSGYDAEEELAAAERLFADSETPFYAAVVQLERAELLLDESRTDEAAPLLAQARETFDRLGARPWLERAEKAAAPQVPA